MLRSRLQFVPGVSIGFCALILAVAQQLGVFRSELPLLTGLRYGFSGRILWSLHRWHSLWTSALLSRNAFMAISLAVSIAVTLGLYEAIAGWRRALVVALGASIIGPVTVAGITELVSLTGNAFALRALQTVDYGASTISASAGGALAAIGGRSLRRTLVFWLIIGSVLHHQLADAEHIVSFGFGFAVATKWTPSTFATARLRRVPGRRIALIAAALLVGFTVGAVSTPGLVAATSPAADSSKSGASTASTATSAGGPSQVPLSHSPSTVALRPAALSPVRVEKRSYPTPSIGGSQTVYVIYPPGYDSTTHRYPVVEFLHGHPGSAVDVVTGFDIPKFMLQPGVPPFIVVAPDGVGPIVADSFYADTDLQHVGTAVSVDLKVWAKMNLRTTDQWAVAGLSAGGYGAAYLTSTHPDMYSAGCSMSGNFTPEGRAFANQSTSVLDAATPLKHTGAALPPMLLIVGANDATGLADANRYHAAMAMNGQQNTVVVGSGGHEWGLWRAELGTCLGYVVNPPPRHGEPAQAFNPGLVP